MFLSILFCSYADMITWLQNNLLLCPFKKLTGLDCPGCGFQRSVIALLQGDLSKSLHFYPATIPLFIVALYSIFNKRLKFDNRHQYIGKSLYVFTGFVIAGSYVLKLSGKGVF